MARYECSACEKSFEADEARCPDCLKKTTVTLEGQAGSDGSAPTSTRRNPARRSLFAGPGLIVTIGILVPFTLYVPQQNIAYTFVAAIIAFGLGHYVNHLFRKWRAK